jgi:hypothetical protein
VPGAPCRVQGSRKIRLVTCFGDMLYHLIEAIEIIGIGTIEIQLQKYVVGMLWYDTSTFT